MPKGSYVHTINCENIYSKCPLCESELGKEELRLFQSFTVQSLTYRCQTNTCIERFGETARLQISQSLSCKAIAPALAPSPEDEPYITYWTLIETKELPHA